MELYVYRIAGIRIGLYLPHSVEITAESAPFLTHGNGTDGACDVDVRVAFVRQTSLPPLPQTGVWMADGFYTRVDGLPAVFWRSAPGYAPYVCVTYGDTVTVSYTQSAEPLLHKSFYLLRFLGTETLLAGQGAVLLHASFVRYGGRGILFSAPSGGGKSTQAALWCRVAGAELLNGDRAGLACRDGIWQAYGLPFAGSSAVFRAECAPVGAIVLPLKGPYNRVIPVSASDALRRLLPECSIHRWDSDFYAETLERLLALLDAVPVYELTCLPNADAVHVLACALHSDGIIPSVPPQTDDA